MLSNNECTQFSTKTGKLVEMSVYIGCPVDSRVSRLYCGV